MKTKSHCRICAARLPKPYLDLGRTPLANSYITDNEVKKELNYELAVSLCENCNLSQLTVVVPPELMFRHYLYVSSTTNTFRAHCEEFVENVLSVLKHNGVPKVLDIGSNDGCLLSYFRKHGAQVMGVDPAKNLAAEANAKNIKTVNTFWGHLAVKEVLNTVGRLDVVTATNVFAHVDEIHDFLTCVGDVLSDTGLFVLEVPYLVDLINRCEFDTVYHEHLSYFLLKPIKLALESHRLQIIDVKYRPIHGGTIRVFVAKACSDYPVRPSVTEMLTAEQSMGFHDRARYESFANAVSANKRQMLELLRRLAAEGKSVAGYGAAAKGNTLLNYYGVGKNYIRYICDDNPKKHSYLMPGSHIPIVSPSILLSDPCDYLLLLAWNFSEEIKQRTISFHEFGGRYICPVPELTIQ